MTRDIRPARDIHPNVVFFREIAARIADEEVGDEDEIFTLQEEIEDFLLGGEMTDRVKIASANYFDLPLKFWENLWSNYTTRQ